MVLRHIIESGIVPVVRLTKVFRQAAHSRIITTAHRINEGYLPELQAQEGDSDFYFIDRAEPEQIANTLVEMVKNRIPAKFKFDPIRDIQVLCPMNRGSLGIRELNVKLQTELNPSRPDEPVVEKFGWQFRVWDKIIQTENDYDKDVFNGDIGQIVKIDPVEPEWDSAARDLSSGHSAPALSEEISGFPERNPPSWLRRRKGSHSTSNPLRHQSSCVASRGRNGPAKTEHQ
jgi:exodeoxyribonuclease V alpha subunit